MAYEPREPSTGSRIAHTAAETAKGVGIGLLVAASVLIAAPAIAYMAFGGLAALAVGALSLLASGPVLFGAAGVTGGIFGARRGMNQNDREAAKAQVYAEGKSILAAQEAQLANAQGNFIQAAAPAPYVMTPAQVNDYPNSRVSNMNYEGQLAAANMQRGVAG